MSSTGLAIGFVGLGVMGTPMVSHLHRHGYSVTLHDLQHDHATALAQRLGARARSVSTPREVAAHSDIVITMLPHGGVVQDVTFGADGLAAGFKPGSLLLDTSSAEPWLTKDTAQRLQSQQVSMVDAPVSGAQWGAEAANLVFMVGGSSADLERVRPVLTCMGPSIFHLGALGAGHSMKCINNLITEIVRVHV